MSVETDAVRVSSNRKLESPLNAGKWRSLNPGCFENHLEGSI